MIITGSLEELVSMHIKSDGTIDRSFTLATLSTNDIFCENVANGYNSSVVLFRTDRCHLLYETLAKYYEHLLRFLMRFDHYLEMLVWNATIVQEYLPGQVVDYSNHFLQGGHQNVPEGCRVVAFPRNPKPHEIQDEWAKKFWV